MEWDRGWRRLCKMVKKMKKLTDYIHSVFLPFEKNINKCRDPFDIKAELQLMKSSYIGRHTLRTINNTLSIPNVSYETRKGIQILRHEFSRKRSSLFNQSDLANIEKFDEHEEDFTSLLNEALLIALLPEKQPTRMDHHLENVLAQYNQLGDQTNETHS